MAEGIKIWVGNTEDYNCGTLHGEWIELPQPEEEIEKFLRDEVGTNIELFGYFFGDHEPLPVAGLKRLITSNPLPSIDIEDLNLVAMRFACMTESELEAVEAWMEAYGTNDPNVFLNVSMQADSIPYYEFNFSENVTEMKSPQEKYGEIVVDGNEELKRFIKNDYKFAYAFDIEEYGRMCAEEYDVKLFETGYMESGYDPISKDLYDHEELAELIREEYKWDLMSGMYPHPTMLREMEPARVGDSPSYMFFGKNCTIETTISPDGVFSVSSTIRNELCPSGNSASERFTTYGKTFEEAYRNNIAEIQSRFELAKFGELKIANPKNPWKPFSGKNMHEINGEPVALHPVAEKTLPALRPATLNPNTQNKGKAH